MNIFKKIFTNKKSEVKELPPDKIITGKLFTCEFCEHKFEIDEKRLFPISVQGLAKNYHCQGIGVICPSCMQTNIYNK